MKAKDSKANPQAQMAVRCSALFGIVLIQSQKSPAHSVRNCRDGRPCDRARKCTHEIRETHEKNLRPSACICGEKKSFAQLNLCSAPNAPDQRPRATDIRHGTETQSRSSLHPVCSAT